MANKRYQWGATQYLEYRRKHTKNATASLDIEEGTPVTYSREQIKQNLAAQSNISTPKKSAETQRQEYKDRYAANRQERRERLQSLSSSRGVPEPVKQTATSSNIRDDALNEYKNRKKKELNNSPLTVSRGMVDYVSQNADNSTAQRTWRDSRRMTVPRALVNAVAEEADPNSATNRQRRHDMTYSQGKVSNAAMDSIRAAQRSGRFTNQKVQDLPEELKNANLRKQQNSPLYQANEEAGRMRRNGTGESAIPEAIRRYTNMTPDEQNKYTQLYNDYGRERAENYLSSIENDVNARTAQQNYESNRLAQNPVGRIAGQFTHGVSRFGEGLENIGSWLAGSDKKKANSVGTYESQIMRDRSSGALENIAQDIASSTGYMAPSAVAGGVLGIAGGVSNAGTIANGLFGLATGGNAYQETLNQGYDKGSAGLYAAQQAVDEAATNYLLGGVQAFGGGVIGKYLGNTAVAQAARNGIQGIAKTPTGKILLGRLMDHIGEAGMEGTQEFLQNYTDKITRNLVLGEDNEISLTDPDAWYSAGIGALNSMLMNTGSDIASLSANEIQHRRERAAQNTPDAEPQEQYVDLGDEDVREAVGGAISPQPTTTQHETQNAVNAAVDELKAQRNTDTSESTPEEAKRATQTAVDAINNGLTEQTTEPEAPETSEAPQDQSFRDVMENATDAERQEVVDAIDENVYPNVSPMKPTEIRGNSNEPKQTLQKPSKRRDEGAGKFIDWAFNQGGIINQNAVNNMSDSDAQMVEDILSGKSTTQAEAPKGETKSPQNIVAERQERAKMRFSNDDLARNHYLGGFATYDSARTVNEDIPSTQTFAEYDDNMAKAYQAGLDGNPISSLQDDSDFTTFDKMVPDLVDDMWKLGYNQYEQNHRAQVPATEVTKVTEETSPATEATQATQATTPATQATQTTTPATQATTTKPQTALADKVAEKVASGKSFTSAWLFDNANKAYGGTQADGTYTVKDAYDGMELGVNKYLMNADFVKKGNGDLNSAIATLDQLNDMMAKLPTQTKRTTEMEQYQQFSTPPTIAYTAAYLANINSNDVVLEPSAGTGDLALWGKAWGATVYGNELSPRRLEFLNQLGLDGTFNENAEHINDILPDNIKPTVVVMNPPFSATAGRMKSNSTKNATAHIEQALERLQDGGRLVAILGRGMSDDSKTFGKWWDGLRDDYTIRANVRIDGSNYKKYGTSFDDQLVVIDKVGPQGDVKTITGEYKDLSKLITDLEGVRNERTIADNRRSDELVQGERGSAAVPVQSGGTDTGRNTGVDTAAERSGNTENVPDRSAENRSGERSTGTVTESAKAESKPGVAGRKPGRIGNADNGNADGAVRLIHDNDSGTGTVEQPKEDINIESAYTPYEPEKVHISGAKPHPGKLVESAAMGAVKPPTPTYTPHLPQSLIDSGKPSSAQLENIVYAGQAHQQMLPNGTRKGYFIGDGTGVGKGLQLASIILDNWNQGRKKAIWVSKNPNLMLDAQRDWKDLGQDPKEIFDFSKFSNKDIPFNEGILFTAYSTIGRRQQAGIDKIEKWVGKDFDGVIVLDEAHMMKNAVPIKGARGKSKPTLAAVWGLKLQEAFPKARVVYATATGASSIENFAYLERLGLWGQGTAFNDFNDFYTKISQGGLSAMELVARDMKAMGVYMARSISYDGVQYDTIEHELTPEQTTIYNKMSEAWRVVLRNINKALEVTGASNNGMARGRAIGAFWSSLQRFYNQILTSMEMPSVIADIQHQLDDGKSVVIQLTNTNAAEADRKIAENSNEGGDLEDLDLTPSEMLVDLLKKSFPVQVYEKYADENGNIQSRPVTDSKGNPVLDKKAVAMRDDLISMVGQMQVPDGALEMILDAFGTDNVAEVTGRQRRVVYQRQADGTTKRVVEKWSKAKGEADTNAFQDGKKRILIFSEAGGTGKSYHADRRAKNQQQRVHYILQPGWKADAAIQGLGRTHRTNEASAPIYKLVTTNAMGQKRFTSTIAKRLNQMGALTKGQRDAGSGIFSEKDNLETPIAEDALATYYRQAPQSLLDDLGIKITDSNGAINNAAPDLRNVPKFLNRILALDIKDQNQVFEDYYSILEQMTEQAIKNGTVDLGMESVKADKVEVIDEKTVHKDEKTNTETKYVQMKVYNKPQLIPYSSLKNIHRNFKGLYRLQDGSVRAVYETGTKTDLKGTVQKKYRLDSPVYGTSSNYVESTLKERATAIPKSEWKDAWKEEAAKAPKYNESTLHMLTGTLLPIWNRLPETNARVMRVITTDGRQYLGRVIAPDSIDATLRGLGTSRTVKKYNPKELMHEILDNGKEVALRDRHWRLNRRKVSGEWRIELTGPNAWAAGSIPGMISERIQSQYRTFVPTGEKGESVLKALTDSNPVMEVRTGSSDDGVLARRSGPEAESRKSGKPTTKPKDNSKDWTATKNKDSNVKESERLSDIIGKAAHDWGFNVTSGSRYVKGQGVMGQFNTKDKGIRTKITNDLPTLSHEFGHWMDKTYSILDGARLTKEVRADLKNAFEKNPDNPASYKNASAETIRKEGLAEFIRYYLQNKDTAGIDYPNLKDHVLKALNPKDLARFNAFADQVNAYYSMDAGNAQSSIRLKEDSRPDYRTPIEKFRDGYHHWYQLNVDSNHGFREFDIKNGTDSYIYATNAAYSDARVAQTIMEDIYDFDGRYVGGGLRKALIGVDIENPKKYLALGELLDLLHGIEWVEHGKRVFADDRKNNVDWMKNRVQEIYQENPEFVGVPDRIYKFESDFMSTYAVGQGLISADAYKAMQKDYPHYVPFFRAGFKDRGNSLMKAKGSGRDLIHPVDNIIDNVTKIMNLACRNAVMLKLRDAAVSSNADAMFMEKIPEPKTPVEVDISGVKQKLSEDAIKVLSGVDPSAQDAMQDAIDQIDNTLLQFKTGKAQAKHKEIKILVNGHPEFWKVNDPLLYDSISTMDYQTTNEIVNGFGKVSRFMTSNITGNNAVWSIFSNAPRDLQTLITFSAKTKNPGKLLVGIGEEYVNSVRHKMGKTVDPFYAEYLAMGGEDAPVWSGSKDYVKDVRKMLNSARKHPELNPLKWVSFVSDTIEAGPRYAIYRTYRKEGIEPQKAFHAAMDITVNFRRHGVNSKMLNNFIPFFNAGVQATDKMYRYFTAEDMKQQRWKDGKWVEINKKARGKTVFGRVAFSVALSAITAALAYALNHRDDEDKENYGMLSTYMKNSYFNIPLGDGKYFSIPKGQNVATLESFFERLYERILDENTHAFDEFADYWTDNSLPSLASDLAKYPVDVAQNGLDKANDNFITGALGSMGAVGELSQIRANKDYLDRPIVGSQYEDKDARAQYNSKSSEMAYLLGKYLNLSPMKVDHVGKNILGWLWTYPSAVLPVDDKNGVKGERDLTLGVKNTYIRDSLYSNDISNWIYDKAEESQKMYNTYGTNKEALESTLDADMKSYYSNVTSLTREDSDSDKNRAIRHEALRELMAYRKETENGSVPKDHKRVYDLVKETGDTSLLPGTMQTKIKADDEEYQLTAREYMDFQDDYEKYYWDSASGISDADSAKTLKQIAKDMAITDTLKKKGVTYESKNKATQWVQSGDDIKEYESASKEIKKFTDQYREDLKEAENNKDRKKSLQNSKKYSVQRIISEYDLSPESQEILWKLAGYTKGKPKFDD